MKKINQTVQDAAQPTTLNGVSNGKSHTYGGVERTVRSVLVAPLSSQLSPHIVHDWPGRTCYPLYGRRY